MKYIDNLRQLINLSRTNVHKCMELLDERAFHNDSGKEMNEKISNIIHSSDGSKSAMQEKFKDLAKQILDQNNKSYSRPDLPKTFKYVPPKNQAV